MKVIQLVFVGLAAIVLIVGFSLLLALPAMWLWNWLMPPIFGLPTVTYWQALGLCLLFRFLFGTGLSSSSSKD